MKKLYLFGLALLTVGCATTTTPAEPPIFQKAQSNVALTDNYTAHRFTEIYFGAQPPAADFTALHTTGFRTVINLRTSAEYDEAAERAAWEALGVHYYQIPYAPKGTLNDAILDQVTETVVKHRAEGKILIHCSSGNRVALWVGGHFHKDHALDPSNAIKMAERLGLTKTAARTKLESYLTSKTQ